MSLQFSVLNTSGGARRGHLVTSRAAVETPAFMPVGTLATVKTLRPEDVAALGYRLILANTYHLHLQPGEAIVQKLGGVQRMMGWDGALLTDSGGYQVFSLAQQRRVDEHGVLFRTEHGERQLTPELSMQIQRILGSDIAMVLDDVPAITAPPAEQRIAMERTHRWAERAAHTPALPGQSRFAIVQGGSVPAWREESARLLSALPFDGYAVGGLVLGESKVQTAELTLAATAQLPASKPRYLMGAGGPDDIVTGVANGIDLFDSVLPTRIARHGGVFTQTGRISLRGAAFANDAGPIDAGCDCLACARYSRGWVRHLLVQGEPLGMRLATLHNLRFLARLMEQIREAIASGTFSLFRDTFAYDAVRRHDLPAA